jgi:cyclophilin family peptidyl-prolyl cis-trans isomerase
LVLVALLAACGTSTTKPLSTATALPRKTFSSAPAMSINIHRTYTAVIDTSDGSITVRLEPSSAPVAVNNFIFLARHHFYDGIVFHRIIKSSYIQAGDPTGTGTGGPGYHFKVEKPKRPYIVGTVAMARTASPDSNGSQFFIIVGPAGTTLPPSYTILGQVTSGSKAISKISDTPVAVNPGTGELSDPLTDVRIKSITIR